MWNTHHNYGSRPLALFLASFLVFFTPTTLPLSSQERSRPRFPPAPTHAPTYFEWVVRVHVEELIILFHAPAERSQGVLHGQASATAAGPTFRGLLLPRGLLLLGAAAFGKGTQVFFLTFQVGIIKAVVGRVGNGCGVGVGWREMSPSKGGKRSGTGRRDAGSTQDRGQPGAAALETRLRQPHGLTGPLL